MVASSTTRVGIIAAAISRRLLVLQQQPRAGLPAAAHEQVSFLAEAHAADAATSGHSCFFLPPSGQRLVVAPAAVAAARRLRRTHAQNARAGVDGPVDHHAAQRGRRHLGDRNCRRQRGAQSLPLSKGEGA